MGWKSRIEITRAEAIKAISEQLMDLHSKTNSQLQDMLEDYGFGDNDDLKWYGRIPEITDE